MDKPNYGVDAPGVVRNLALIGVIGISSRLLLPLVNPSWRNVATSLLWMGISCGLAALVMFWSSRVGKFWTRDSLLRAIPWRGDEEVLDVGCGHGLMLIGAAQRLTTGHATGIDIWQNEDQANNSPQATMLNAKLAGVEERVTVRDGDARAIDAADGAFDLILSSFAIHNIYDPSERRKALSEIVRVLKPGGYVGIIDIRHGLAYRKYFASNGLSVIRTRVSLLFAIPTYSILVRKS